MNSFNTEYMFIDPVRISIKTGEKLIGVIKEYDGSTIWLWPSEEIVNDKEAYVVKENGLGISIDQVTRIYPL